MACQLNSLAAGVKWSTILRMESTQETPPRRWIEVSVARQTCTLWQDGSPQISWPVSTAARGTGFAEGSLRTPTGRFRIAAKIGAGAEPGTVFKGRRPVGHSSPESRDFGPDDDLITSRILTLDGLDPANANTLERYVYFHGTNHEDKIGRPASHGCIRLRNDDIIALFDLVEMGDLVLVHESAESLQFFNSPSECSLQSDGNPPS